ncbi:DUF2125 domain-containing protein [Thioclava nitratireducens]|uniref:DUF2125 domain-containing protein n=1 Tax=Thioclava nitratireducens TaxID=1915078 RepID=UPI002480A29C|nr:DUF2125 domain-containing protein [Thioclava nitratireducens]WGT49821.1 DUF2125 domain-containing protein [Thioclava nitratireducens]
MRKLIILVLVATLAYCGYWFYGAHKIENGARDMLAQARQEGWGDAQSVSLAGFPSRFDLTFDKPELKDRGGLWRWSAPFAQIFALGYEPNKVIAYLPSGQMLHLGDKTYRLTQDDMRASMTVGYSTALPLENAVAVVASPVLTPQGAAKPELSADQLRLAIARKDKAQGAIGASAQAADLVMPAAAYRLGAEAKKLKLPADLLERIDPKGTLPDTITRLHFDALMGTREPIDRSALEAGLPGLMTFAISDLSLSWGDNDVSVEGNLTVDPSGYPDGTLTIRSASWRNWVGIAQGMGLIGKDEVKLVTGIGAMLAAKNPDGALEVPLIFKDGQMSLGPVPLGPAPQLVAQRQ